MPYAPLLIALVFVSLVTGLYYLLVWTIQARVEAAEQLQKAARLSGEIDQRELALRSLRHDANNVLGNALLATDVARKRLSSDPANLALVENAFLGVRRAIELMQAHHDGNGEAQGVDVGEVLTELTLPWRERGYEIELGPGLSELQVPMPGPDMIAVIANLIRNALEAASRVKIYGSDDGLVFENPVRPADLEFLRSHRDQLFRPGTSGKAGDDRGTGLYSASQAAERCNASLGFELFRLGADDWVRFVLRPA